MGRRSINTTKSGKYMNPTDQARKEARKKELKKNKRQRQMVRAAVLKNKDPSQILEEMEKIDEMEYNVLQPSPLNEKVLRDKRKKLKETFDRVMRLYHNDEPEHWAELKRKEVEYEKKRLKKQQYYESVKHAQSVQVDEIPLPAPVTAAGSAPSTAGSMFPAGPGGAGIRLPPPPMTMALPPFAPGAPPGVTAKNTAEASAAVSVAENPLEKPIDDDDKDWLGVPPGPPPDLFAMRELDSDAEGNSDYEGEDGTKEENLDDFMKEMEHVHKRKHRHAQEQRDKSEEHENGAARDDDEDEEEDDGRNDSGSDRSKSPSISETSDSEAELEDDDEEMPEALPTAPALPAIPLPPSATPLPVVPPPQLPQMPPPLHNMAPPPPSGIMYRPPPMRPPHPGGGPGAGFGMRMPPGPPPPGSRPPHGMSSMPRMGLRMPPGPPPGMPPRMAGHHQKPGGGAMPPKDSAKGVTTITAKPQIRNLSADVTRFVPSTLRVKRNEDQRRTAVSRPKHPGSDHHGHHGHAEAHSKPPTKDDAYLQFMNEMQGLL